MGTFNPLPALKALATHYDPDFFVHASQSASIGTWCWQFQSNVMKNIYVGKTLGLFGGLLMDDDLRDASDHWNKSLHAWSIDLVDDLVREMTIMWISLLTLISLVGLGYICLLLRGLPLYWGIPLSAFWLGIFYLFSEYRMRKCRTRKRDRKGTG